MHGRDEKSIQYLVRKLEGKRPLRRPRCRWEDNIRMDPKDLGWEYVDWIQLVQDRDHWQALGNVVMNHIKVFWVILKM
jgi:hypothetical protein